MDSHDREWKARFEARPRGGSAPPCPRTETLSKWATGPIPDDGLAHLAACFSCREDLIEARRRVAEQGKTEFPNRKLYALMPPRRLPYGWIAAAAAALFAAILYFALSGNETPKTPVAIPPKPKPAPVREPEPPPVAPEPKKPAPPTPEPEKKPEPPSTPPPVKETPAVAKPTPEPEKKPEPPPPPPEKPAPALTRAKLKGTLFGLAGTSQVETEASQPLKVGQSRDFMGLAKIKADSAATKLRVGTVTYYLQRGAEVALTLEEGRTGVKLAKGEAFFDVTPGQTFEVEMPLGTVAVKGTRFLVSEADVAVQRGSVQLGAVMIAAGERSTGAAAQKFDLGKRLAWVRALEDTISIEADQMALQNGMEILPDPTASGGRAIGIKNPPKTGDAVAEIRAKRKQPTPYTVWIRLHWGHGVPSSLTLSVGDALTWSSKAVAMNANWQWVRVGTAELPDQAFPVRLSDTHAGMRIDQIVLTSDPDFNPENK